jgi:hypothetical protein
MNDIKQAMNNISQMKASSGASQANLIRNLNNTYNSLEEENKSYLSMVADDLTETVIEQSKNIAQTKAAINVFKLNNNLNTLLASITKKL